MPGWEDQIETKKQLLGSQDNISSDGGGGWGEDDLEKDLE